MAQKKLKASEGSRASESEPDRLSSLPDDVLCHILSFLPTKESVGTRVLSTRWKYLFASVSILNFCCYCHDAFKRNNFIDFVNSIWISYEVSHMEKFHLTFQGRYGMIPPDLCLISSWLCVAIRRHVKEIDFTIQNSYEAIALPRDLLSSKTLSVLKLCGNFKISLPNNVFLPCLKTCELEEVCLSDELAKRLFRSLPALETLELRECDVIEDFQVFNISSPNLKRLRILDCDGEYQIVLNVPNLHYFEFYGFVTKDVVGLETLKSVVDASLSYFEDSGSRDDIFMNLLRALCHVKELALTSRVIEAFVLSGQSLPKFNNLIRLTLGSISSLASKVLPDLLNNTPRLETFSFNQWGADDHQENYSLPERVPDCVSHHLQVVKCLFFAGSEYDRKLLNYFRKNAKNLKDMNIQSRYTYNERGAICPAARHIVFDPDDIYEIRHEALKEGIHSPQVCTNVHGRNDPEQESMQ